MRSCRDIAWLLSSGRLEESPAHVRLEAWMHVAVCRHCRAFRRALARLTALARDAHLAVGDPRAGFEDAIVHAVLETPPVRTPPDDHDPR